MFGIYVLAVWTGYLVIFGMIIAVLGAQYK